MKKIGFTIGKFAPLHKGHQYLIEKALEEMDEFYVVIYETDKINISIEERAQWIKQKYKDVKILYAYNPPNQYGLDKKSVNIQMKYLSAIIKGINFTHFYSSEKYGYCVAKYLKINEVTVDRKRIKNPISSTRIRKEPNKNKIFLEDSIYEDINKKKKL